jgi:hypothetical protein
MSFGRTRVGRIAGWFLKHAGHLVVETVVFGKANRTVLGHQAVHFAPVHAFVGHSTWECKKERNNKTRPAPTNLKEKMNRQKNQKKNTILNIGRAHV